MKCAIPSCQRDRYVNGTVSPFCSEHTTEFRASPEGRFDRPTDASDWRDRKWKEAALTRAKEPEIVAAGRTKK